MHWRKKWQPTPVFLPGESRGWGSLVGCRLWTGENQTQEQSSIYSHLSIYVDRREHQRNPDPGTVHSLQSSERLCGQEETPEKPRSRNSPQSAVMSVKGKTEMLTEGEGDWGREHGL